MRNPPNYWNFEKCKEIALLCNSRSEFKNKYPSAYVKCIKNKWLEEIFYHLPKTGNLFNRMIYLYIFPNEIINSNNDITVYVGLTFNKETRNIKHLSNENSPIYKYKQLTNIKPFYIKLSDYIPVDEAKILEEYWINYYKINNFKVLNCQKGGTTGGIYLKWDYDRCKEEAKKYKTKTEFTKYSKSASNSCYKNSWIDDFFPIIKPISKIKQPFTITYDEFLIEIQNYETKSNLFKFNRKVYDYSVKYGWLDSYFYNIKLEELKSVYKKFKNRSEFKKFHSGLYHFAKKNYLLYEYYPKK